MEKELYIDIIDEKFYENTFENGLKCFVFPKKDFLEKQVMFAVNYGSSDNVFIEGEKIKKEPEGSFKMVGMTRFERATPSSQARCATKLRYIPSSVFTFIMELLRILV